MDSGGEKVDDCWLVVARCWVFLVIDRCLLIVVCLRCLALFVLLVIHS